MRIGMTVFAAGVACASLAYAQSSKPERMAPAGATPAKVVAPGQVQGPSAPGSVTASDLEKRLEEIDARAAKIEDLAAEFEQQKKTPLLKRPLTSSGKVLVKGARTRWDTGEPHATVMTIDSKELKIYYPDQKTVEVYPIDAGMARLAASPLPRLKTIQEQFTVTEVGAKEIDPQAKHGELGLKLVPIRESLREHVEQVRVLVDPATAIGRRVEITDADGEVTTLTFKNVRTNTGVKDEQLDLKVPKGTTISRPLQGEGPKPADDSKPGDKPARAPDPKEKK